MVNRKVISIVFVGLILTSCSWPKLPDTSLSTPNPKPTVSDPAESNQQERDNSQKQIQLKKTWVGNKFEDYEYPEVEMYVENSVNLQRPGNSCYYLMQDYYESKECILNTPNTMYLLRFDDENNFELEVNGEAVWSKNLLFAVYDPIKDFFTLGDDLILAYDDIDIENNYKIYSDILINGKESINEKFSLDRSYAPTIIDDTLVFFSQKGNQMFVIYDETEYELDFDSVVDPPCCEPAMFSVTNNERSVYFYALEQNDWYQVEMWFE